MAHPAAPRHQVRQAFELQHQENIEMPDQINEVLPNQVSINQLLRNHVKEKLGRGDVVASVTVRLVRGVEIARIAKTAGFDSLYVDMEHSSFSLETTGQICIAALEVGITPLVRVPGVAHVSRVLDAGALGVIAPHVQSTDEARYYVEAAKFPPLGQRSAAGPLPHLQYRSFPSAQADAALNDATILIVQFESEQALSNADAIAAVDGVDLVMIGSNDLLADWGLAGQYEHPRLRDAYAKTIAACRYVSTGTDLGFLLAACTAKAKEVQDLNRK
jgi:2-keto-3-deoxy-L-rhamnonate aldolase RhmA